MSAITNPTTASRATPADGAQFAGLAVADIHGGIPVTLARPAMTEAAFAALTVVPPRDGDSHGGVSVSTRYAALTEAADAAYAAYQSAVAAQTFVPAPPARPLITGRILVWVIAALLAVTVFHSFPSIVAAFNDLRAFAAAAADQWDSIGDTIRSAKDQIDSVRNLSL